ncbi:MAG: type II toxin-antitoxin system VapC family toxin [Magnetococcus sp. YQC-9]
MNYLLDSNIVSETVRAKPSEYLMAWLEPQPQHSLFISVLTIGEIRRGVEKLSPVECQDHLRYWLGVELMHWFGNRILPIDKAVADRWGLLLGRSQRTLPAVDSFLAATALQHGLSLVTRNEKDFRFPELTVINPWRELN